MTLKPGQSLRDNRADHGRRRVLGRACLPAVALALAATASPAGAVTNGVIAFEQPSIPTIATVQDPADITASQAAAPASATLAKDPIVVPGLPTGSANPAWSRDGTMLAFSSTTGCFTGITVIGSPHLCVMNADGTGLKPATRDPAAAIDPTWSPDGARLAYSSFANGQPDIYVAPIGGVPKQLTTDPARDQQAEWSPDGRQIAFESDRDGTSNDIWLMAADGTNQRAITRDPADESDAAWNPDPATNLLAFSSGPRGGNARAIFTIKDDGTQRTALTGMDYRSIFPAWSPDRNRIAFSQDGNLVVMPAAGILAAPASATLVTGGGTDPVWAPLPVPSAKPKDTVLVDLPGPSKEVPAAADQALPTGTKVNATDGEMTVNFLRPGVPAAETSTVKVESAEFTIADRTPSLLTVRVKPPACPGAAVTAAKKGGSRKTTRTRIDDRKGGKTQTIHGHGNTAPLRTRYVVLESCRGMLVTVSKGTVLVTPTVGKRRNTTVRVRAGHRYFVAGQL